MNSFGREALKFLRGSGLRWFVAAGLVLAALSRETPCRAQVLDGMRNYARGTAEPVGSGYSPSASSNGGNSSSSGGSDSNSGWGWGNSDDDTNDGNSLLYAGALFVGAATSPFWAPPIMLNDTGYPLSFNRYPYHCGEGLMFSDTWCDIRPRSTSCQFSTEYGHTLNGIETVGSRLLVTGNTYLGRWGVDTEWNYRQEDLDMAGHDMLWTGDFNIVYRFAQSPWAQMHTGLGVNWLADRDRGDLGFNFTYGGDFFPRDPFVVSSTLDIGTVGDAFLFHGRATVGVMVQRFEVYTGVDYFSVDEADMTSLVAGVRLWW